ncbi:MAG: hypothetical protein A3D56_02325 [Candidatus Taylorbacteria bacterium RIFCSPHIGHO2_02_FULL_45_35]|uniref:Aspartyl/glutamyl-tRNA(Asn/Gln) amidotransferase subunit C n=1 Tax=Candidatus Taylorbacteria bacterium RIFCSPHIGHO2_02_FULL_45_35 TaxID=1802311 RepID=A0A1G2MSR9_9BACT|nr:MAG: hypothetical protein A3D56_02325 [Candidatus Taylorbacteria bacterium RIFCSPHIGHO2_02_FULL_45_35]OHA32830.1 MAG: hypothetical protein A3A22_02760 [Candidatus Taylorbacteria bacterium RIFCSPLOWO2_01_FULL_45_34b]
MLTVKDIEKLAELARIDIPTEEKETLRKEVEAILGYVGEIQKVAGESAEKEIPNHRNVFREDSNPHLSGEFTKELLEEVPRRQDEYVKVKKIL